jgi:phytoene/squalene synthetase
MELNFYLQNCYKISKIVTKSYSTSFSLATLLLEKNKRKAIYSIYGFVRLADEIVDSFHNFDKKFLLEEFINDTNYALSFHIHTNPILMAFADTAYKYKIQSEFINAFFESMKLDLNKTKYETPKEIDKYIYGSAEVVGLMCLKVFCEQNEVLYNKLEHSAKKLGSVFQKINFLRDLKYDINNLGRVYFPEVKNFEFNSETKAMIEKSIEMDLIRIYSDIKQLPGRSKLAVSIAYSYYFSLFKKIKIFSAEKVLTERIRISNLRKILILLKEIIKYCIKL